MKSWIRHWPACLAVGLVWLWGAEWAGALGPPALEGGIEFQVNSSTSGNQLAADSARLLDGKAVVVWETVLGTGGLRARVLSPSGLPVAPDFEVPSAEEGVSSQPTVAAGGSPGTFVVAWRSKISGDTEPDIAGRLFVGSGDPIGQDFVVNEGTEGFQGMPSAAMSSDGGFLVAWTGAGNDLWGRTFDSEGSSISGDVLLQGDTEVYNFRHDVAAIPGGKFVVTWTNYDVNTPSSRVQARWVSAAGELLGARIDVSDLSELATTPAVAVNAVDGSVLIAWHQVNIGRALPVSIFGRRLTSDGTTVGGTFQISDAGVTSWYPAVTESGVRGQFVVAWETGSRFDVETMPGTDGSGLAVNARIVRDGLPVGSSIQVNEHTSGNQLEVTLTRTGTQSFLAAWSSETGPGDDLSGTKIEGRRITASEGVFADGFESEGVGAWSTTWPGGWCLAEGTP